LLKLRRTTVRTKSGTNGLGRAAAASGAAVALLLSANSARAQDPGGEVAAADKSHYHLFHPTPPPLMRGLSADRPDVTESPYTVDAGHVQVELSFVEYTRDQTGPDTEATTVLPFNVKFGLLNNLDVQLVLDPYVRLRGGGDGGHADGFGDTQLRLKWNLWGNDGGDTALAVMPFVQFPTGADGVGAERVEGGVIVPFAVGLTERLGLGLMAEVDFRYEPGDGDYFAEFVHTASLGCDLTEAVGAYVEYVGLQPSDGGEYLASVGTGLTLAASDDVQFDLGVNVGLTDEADDFVVFSGVTFRL
jgi:hypothetical protein